MGVKLRKGMEFVRNSSYVEPGDDGQPLKIRVIKVSATGQTADMYPVNFTTRREGFVGGTICHKMRIETVTAKWRRV